jgi:hypothetical protein
MRLNLCSVFLAGVLVIPGFPDLNRKLSLSHSRIMGSSLRDGKLA